MHEPFRIRFQALEEQRQQLFDSLASVEDARLMKQPSEGAWSVTQVLRHLISAETASLAYLRKKLQYADSVKPSTLTDRLRAGLLRAWLALPLKAKAPANLGSPPAGEQPLAVFADYKAVREEWQEALENIPEQLRDGQLFRHAIAGRMDLSEALTFFHSHFAHHEKQISRILSAV